MAVTSIWAVHRSIKDALDYAANPEKTENPNEEDLKRLMDYAENPDKTEQRYLISGVNCLPELAYERMMETKRRYGNTEASSPITDTKASNPVKLHPSNATRSVWSLPRGCGEISMKC